MFVVVVPVFVIVVEIVVYAAVTVETIVVPSAVNI